MTPDMLTRIAAFMARRRANRPTSHGDAATSPYNIKRMREDMIASAQTPEERRYLEELDQLELHRRHLIC